ncbi:Chromatin modification-related protein YNG2 [Thelohanellus kitauei]|uniref:Chromatin modification-related protein YNG2 n=1 Tax=Thelohanellus kitauei TaxID=669202 RepID=A0A0C2I8M6_THEKT|nr:Chromatin modification-related protein YNG2 [Thelohanellus kitauei]
MSAHPRCPRTLYLNQRRGSAVPKKSKSVGFNKSPIPSHPLIRSKKKKVLNASTLTVSSDPSILQETPVTVEISTSLITEPATKAGAQTSLDQGDSSELPKNLNHQISINSQNFAGHVEVLNEPEPGKAVTSPIQRRQSARLIITPKGLPDSKKSHKEVYCICRRAAFGEMIACDCKTCPYEWFHYGCVSISEPPPGKWFCSNCKKRNRK